MTVFGRREQRFHKMVAGQSSGITQDIISRKYLSGVPKLSGLTCSLQACRQVSIIGQMTKALGTKLS